MGPETVLEAAAARLARDAKALNTESSMSGNAKVKLDASGDMANDKAQTAPESWPTRREVAARLGVDERSVRRWVDAGKLQAQPDAAGVHRCDPQAVEELARARAAQLLQDQGAAGGVDRSLAGPSNSAITPSAIDGNLAAAVFALLNGGKSRREVVVLLKLHPDIVEDLHARWVKAGGGVMFEEQHLARLERRSGYRERHPRGRGGSTRPGGP